MAGATDEYTRQSLYAMSSVRRHYSQTSAGAWGSLRY